MDFSIGVHSVGTVTYRSNHSRDHEMVGGQSRNGSDILISDGKIYRMTSYDEIVCIQADHHYSNVFLVDDKNMLSSVTLNQFEQVLPTYFFRIHKSFIINLNHIKYFKASEKNKIILSNGLEVQVAYRRRSEFIKRLKGGK